MSESSSAAHWCKSVIEEVISPLSSVPPPPMPVMPPTYLSKMTSQVQPALHQSQPTPSLSQYEQYYAQYYSSIGATQSTAATPTIQTVKQPQYATTTAHVHVQSVQLQQSQSMYQYPYPQQPPPPQPAAPFTYVQAVTKKPNPTRFSTAPPAAAPTLSAVSTATTTAPAEKPSVNKGWSPSLKAYVEKCFTDCKTDDDRAKVTDLLQDKIKKVAADGRLSIHRWDLEPTIPVPSVAKIVAVVNPVSSSIAYLGSSSSSSSTTTSTLPLSSNDDNSKKRKKNRWTDASAASTTATGNGIIATAAATQDTKNSFLEQAVKKSKGGILETADGTKLTRSELEMREKRANRFNSSSSSSSSMIVSQPASHGLATNKDKKNKNSNKKIQAVNISGKSYITTYSSYEASESAEFDLESLKVVGTCQVIEKNYLRLTSAPNPNTVRPEPILKLAMAGIKDKWRSKSVEYINLCSQLKALRQDLTVQHIQNEFTVEVYETHARIALDCKDLNEYNQCQTQLKHLYAKGLKGSESEFVAYRILYYVYLLGNKKYHNGGSDLAFIMQFLLPRSDLCENPAIIHALQVRAAMRTENYFAFFQLYKSTPNMGNCILDMMIDSFRLLTLQRICKSYKPTVEASFVITQLGFELTPLSTAKKSRFQKEPLCQGIEFLKKAGCIIVRSEEQVNSESSVGTGTGTGTGVACEENKWEISTKDSVIDFSAVFTQDKLLL